jgi:hypothetical protein
MVCLPPLFRVWVADGVDALLDRNRNSESGSRWQIGGAFAVGADGVVRWSKPAASADEVPNFKEALRALGVVGI